jgi:HPt (histidine-containing phosphotransfer) domain-containing protein
MGERRVVGVPAGRPHAPHEANAPPAAEDAAGLEAMMRDLRVEYMAGFADVLADFDALVTDGDAAALGGLGHRLKGNGASYGFPKITEIGAEIEALGKAGRLDAIVPLIDQLRQIHTEFQSGSTQSSR